MIAHRAHDRRATLATAAGRLFAIAGMTAAAGIMLSARAVPVKLVGVSATANAVLIEATEPVAYSVGRPDPLTLTVDMRNVSVDDARRDVTRGGAVADVRLEQATAVDGRSIARVTVVLARPSEYRVRSARNTIRVELSPGDAPASRGVVAEVPLPAAAVPASVPTGVEPATRLERVQTNRSPDSTTVTLSGNGHLVPAGVTESQDQPRRLVLDFPNVSSRAPAQTSVDSDLVSRVRVGLNSQEPLVTRVVMEIADAAVYHVERAGESGRDFAVVFQHSQTPGTIMLAPPAAPSAAPREPEPAITMQEAIANAAPLTPKDEVVVDAMAALNTVASEAAARTAITPAASEPAAAAPDRDLLVAPPVTRQASGAATVSAGVTPTPVPKQAPAVAPPASAPAPRPAAPQASGQAQTPAPAQPPAQPPSGQRVSGEQQKQFTGHPISMDFQGVDLRAVLRSFAEISGLNMVIDPDVQGTVDIVLTEVPWDQALEVILRGNQLDYTVDGTIVRIARIDTLKKEQDARQALAKSAADAGSLAVRTFALSYARAAQAAPLIKRAALSQRGDVQIDERTNTLIVTDLPARLDTAASLLATIDRAEPQVEVEARIVQTTRDFARAVGIQWGLNGRVMPDVGNTTPLAFPNRGTLGGRLGSQGPVDPRSTPLEQTGSAVDLGIDDASSAIGLALGAVNGAFNLDVALSALERTGKGRVLSSPRLTTQNNVEADVAQGIQIPIQTVANNTVTVSFKDAVLVLKVTPQITAANTVIMRITIENATPDFSRQVNGIPPIDTQRANTQVQIDDGATTVIGGIFVSQEQQSKEQTPLLNRIPLLGWLFKRERVEDESRELLIFITPRILKG